MAALLAVQHHPALQAPGAPANQSVYPDVSAAARWLDLALIISGTQGPEEALLGLEGCIKELLTRCEDALTPVEAEKGVT